MTRRCPYYVELGNLKPEMTYCALEEGHEGRHALPPLLERQWDKGEKYAKSRAIKVFIRDAWKRAD